MTPPLSLSLSTQTCSGYLLMFVTLSVPTAAPRTSSWVSPPGHGTGSFSRTIRPRCFPVVTLLWIPTGPRIKMELLALVHKACHSFLRPLRSLILCVSLTGLSGGWIFGQTRFWVSP